VIAGNTVSYSITDNGVGDRSNVLGQINDPAGLALPGVASVPTLNEWTLALLAVLLGGSAGWVGLRRGARATGRRCPP
jgi:hypothetical protein